MLTYQHPPNHRQRERCRGISKCSLLIKWCPAVDLLRIRSPPALPSSTSPMTAQLQRWGSDVSTGV